MCCAYLGNLHVEQRPVIIAADAHEAQERIKLIDRIHHAVEYLVRC